MTRSDPKMQRKIAEMVRIQLPGYDVELRPHPAREVMVGDLGHLWFAGTAAGRGMIVSQPLHKPELAERFSFSLQDDGELVVAVADAVNALLHPGKV